MKTLSADAAMKTLSATLALAVAIGAGFCSAPASAANARHPYQNVDKRVDKGGPTGDDQVERLNQQQLDSARSQSGYVVGAPQVMGAPVYQPRPAR